MKKVIYSIGAIILSSLLLFTACTNEEENGPEISFLNNVNEVTVSPGNSYTIAGTITSEAGLKTVKFFEVTNEGKTQKQLVDEFENKNEFMFMFTVENITQNITIEVEATDKNNTTTSKYFYIKVSSGQTQNLKTYTVSLGAQDNATGSFLIASQGTVFTISQVISNSAYNDIDIIYYYGATNKYALLCPKSIVQNNITWKGSISTGSWGTSPNITIFKKVSTADYDNATYSSVANLITSNDNSLIAVDLQVGDVVAFKTNNGKYGILKVTEISGTEASSKITFSYKIQE